MKCIVNPQYRWLNLLLALAYMLVALSQVIQTFIKSGEFIHLPLAVLFAFLSFSIYRAASWAYIAVGILNLLGVLGLLNMAASLTATGFVGLLLSAAAAWCAFFLRGQLLVQTVNENS